MAGCVGSRGPGRCKGWVWFIHRRPVCLLKCPFPRGPGWENIKQEMPVPRGLPGTWGKRNIDSVQGNKTTADSTLRPAGTRLGLVSSNGDKAAAQEDFTPRTQVVQVTLCLLTLSPRLKISAHLVIALFQDRSLFHQDLYLRHLFSVVWQSVLELGTLNLLDFGNCYIDCILNIVY